MNVGQKLSWMFISKTAPDTMPHFLSTLSFTGTILDSIWPFNLSYYMFNTALSLALFSHTTNIVKNTIILSTHCSQGETSDSRLPHNFNNINLTLCKPYNRRWTRTAANAAPNNMPVVRPGLLFQSSIA